MSEFERRKQDRRRPSPGLLRALEIVEAMPREPARPIDSERPQGPTETRAHGYNMALMDARAAILEEIQTGKSALILEEHS